MHPPPSPSQLSLRQLCSALTCLSILHIASVSGVSVPPSHLSILSPRHDASPNPALFPRGYEDIDPKRMFCETAYHATALVGNTLYIDGGAFAYNNGTQNYGPNMWLRTIDLSNKFVITSKLAAPVTFQPRPASVLELSSHGLFPSPPTSPTALLQLLGHYEQSDTAFPGYTPPTQGTYNEIGKYTLSSQTWSQEARNPVDSAGAPVARVSFSAKALVRNKAYFLGGEPGAEGAPDPKGRMLTYDLSSGTWENQTTPFIDGWTRALMNHVEAGPEGLLAAFAGNKGGSAPTQDGRINRVELYSFAHSTWLQTQPASAGDPAIGLPTERELACSVIAAAPDNSSYNIYMFGGNGQFSLSPNAVWILSIPSFTWFRASPASTSSSQPYSRIAHSCNVVGKGKRSMMVYGGRSLQLFSQPCETTGIHVFDMTSLKWTDTFNPDEGPYEVPKMVYDVIGGNGKGGATLKPPTGFADDRFEEFFSKYMMPRKPTSTSTQSSEPSKTSGAPGSTDSVNPPPVTESSGSNTPTGLIGGLVGGIVALLLICGIAFWVYRSRKQQAARTELGVNSTQSFVAVEAMSGSGTVGYYDPKPVPLVPVEMQTMREAQELPGQYPRELPGSQVTPKSLLDEDLRM